MMGYFYDSGQARMTILSIKKPPDWEVISPKKNTPNLRGSFGW